MRLLFLLLLLAVAGCKSAPTEEQWNSVQIGMNEDEVKAILGEPDDIGYLRGRDVWWYHGRGVNFGPDGTVIGR